MDAATRHAADVSEWSLRAWVAPTPAAGATVATFSIETWPITTAVVDAHGPFDDVDDFRRRALCRSERRMRVYELPTRRAVRIAVPEDYALALEATRRVRAVLNGETVDDAPPGTVVDPSLLDRALPEDFISLLDSCPLPSVSVIDAIILLDEANPADAWYRQSSGDASFVSAASASNRVITMYRAERRPELRGQLLHELAHLLGDWSEVDMHWFAVAVDVEADGYMHRARAALSVAENWAVHLGECVLGDDGEQFLRFCHAAPVRAAILGRVLARLVDEGRDRWKEPAAGRREVYLSTIVRATAMDALRLQLSDSAEKDPRDARARLLLTLANGAPLSGFEMWTRLDLSDAMITNGALPSLRDFVSLEELNLSGTLLLRGGLQKLPALPRLRRLDLHGSSLWSSDMQQLEGLPSIEWLDVSGTKINLASFTAFRRLPMLRYLCISDTDAADSVSVFRDALPECVIEA